MCGEQNLVESSGTDWEMENSNNKVCFHACTIPWKQEVCFLYLRMSPLCLHGPGRWSSATERPVLRLYVLEPRAHRRLWRGPGFSFNTVQLKCKCTPCFSSNLFNVFWQMFWSGPTPVQTGFQQTLPGVGLMPTVGVIRVGV